MYYPLTSIQDADLLERNIHIAKSNPKARTSYARLTYDGLNKYLHRLIMERVLGRKLSRSEKVDHINGDGLDNRRSNLRVVTHAENLTNRSGWKKSSSKYKGVTWFKRDSKWQAKICPKGKTIHLGYFDSEIDAAKAYNEAAKIYFNSACKLNEV